MGAGAGDQPAAPVADEQLTPLTPVPSDAEAAVQSLQDSVDN